MLLGFCVGINVEVVSEGKVVQLSEARPQNLVIKGSHQPGKNLEGGSGPAHHLLDGASCDFCGRAMHGCLRKVR